MAWKTDETIRIRWPPPNLQSAGWFLSMPPLSHQRSSPALPADDTWPQRVSHADPRDPHRLADIRAFWRKLGNETTQSRGNSSKTNERKRVRKVKAVAGSEYQVSARDLQGTRSAWRARRRANHWPRWGVVVVGWSRWWLGVRVGGVWGPGAGQTPGWVIH